MDLNKLTLADKIIIASGLLLFIAYFLPWFKATADSGFGEFSVEAKGSDLGFLWSTFPMLIGLALAALVIATKLFDAKLPDTVPLSRVFLGLGALAAVLVLLKLVIGENDDQAEALGVEISRSIGIFLAALAALGLAAGGFLKYQGGEDTHVVGDGTGPGSAPF